MVAQPVLPAGGVLELERGKVVFSRHVYGGPAAREPSLEGPLAARTRCYSRPPPMAQETTIYDLMLLLSTEASDEQREKLLADVEAAIPAGGGSVERKDEWGRRPLTFRIRHQTEADYHLLQFSGPPALLESLSHSLRIADGVLRFRIIKVLPGQPPPPESAPIVASVAPPAASARGGSGGGSGRRRGIATRLAGRRPSWPTAPMWRNRHVRGCGVTARQRFSPFSGENRGCRLRRA